MSDLKRQKSKEEIRRLGSVITRSTMRGLGGPELLTAGLVVLSSDRRSLTRKKNVRSALKKSSASKKTKRVRFAEAISEKKYKKRSKTRNSRRRRKS